MLPFAARLFLKARNCSIASVWEEVGAEGILPLVIKSWHSWARGRSFQRLKKINQEMYSFLAGTSEKKTKKKKGRASRGRILGGPAKCTLQCIRLLL